MFKSLRKPKDNLFTTKSQQENNYISLYSHLKLAKYTEEEVKIIKDHYSFLKVNEDNFYIYKHNFKKKFLEITPLGNLCSGRIDLYNYLFDEIDKRAW